MTISEPVIERGSGALAQVWQELLDARFPQGVNINVVGEDGRLVSPTRNVPVLVVMELAGQWPVLRGFPMQAPQGLDYRLTPTSWQELDRSTFAVRVGQETGPDVVLSARISDVLAERMAPLREDQRSVLTTQAQVTATVQLEKLGADSTVRLSAEVAGLLFPVGGVGA